MALGEPAPTPAATNDVPPTPGVAPVPTPIVITSSSPPPVPAPAPATTRTPITVNDEASSPSVPQTSTQDVTATKKVAPPLLLTTGDPTNVGYPPIIENTAGPSTAEKAKVKRKIRVIPPKPKPPAKPRKKNAPKKGKSVEKSGEATGE